MKVLHRIMNTHKTIKTNLNSIWFKFGFTIALSIPLVLGSFIDIAGIFKIEEQHLEKEILVLVILASTMYATILWTFTKECLNELRSAMPGICTIILFVSTLFELNVIFSQNKFRTLLFFDMASVIDLLFLNYMIIRGTLNRLANNQFIYKQLPLSAHIKLGDETKTVASETLHKGDLISVNSGDLVPCDGVILEGFAAVKDPFLSEISYAKKGPGAEITAGTLCVEGNFTLRVVNPGKGMFVNKIAEIFSKALTSTSNLQKNTVKIGLYLFGFTVVVFIVQFVYSYLLVKDSIDLVIQKSVTILVISCFYVSYCMVQLCAFLSLRRLASQGIFVNHRDSFENARKIDVIVFDRTGTLTEDRFGVVDIVTFSQRLTKDEIIKFAASVEHKCGNSIARAVVEFSHEIFPVVTFQTIENQGVEGFVEGKNVKVVNVNFLIEKGIKYDVRRHNEMRGEGKTVVYVLIENELYGAIILSDVIRAEVRGLINKLKKKSIKTVLLTAETKDSARWIANELQLDNYLAEVQKTNSVNKIKEFQSKGFTVGVTGNITKDAEILKHADVGFALGTGTDIEIETADIFHYYRNPREILQVIAMSELTYKKIFQNLLWIFLYTVFATGVALGVFSNWKIVISPALGAILALLGTLVVILNSRFYHYVKK